MIMEIIDREDHQKLYLQLYEIIKKKIETNEWTVGSQIPTEDELCRIFNISRATVRTAVLELVRQGYLKRQQGKGTFICKKVISEGIIMLTNFKEMMLEEGLNISMSVLARTVMMPVDNLHIKLDISPDKHVIYMKKLWFVDHEPAILKEIYIPYHICPHLLEDDIENDSLFNLFEKKHGIKITRVKNYIDTTQTNKNESRVLMLPENAAVSFLSQKFYSADTLIMYSRSIKRPDKFKFFMEFERKSV